MKIRRVSSGELINTINVSDEAVMAVKFSPDSAYWPVEVTTILLGCGVTGSVPVSGSAAFSGHSDGIIAMMFSRDRRTLITGSGDCTLRVWDTRDLQERFVFTGHASAIQCADWSDDESLLVSGTRDGTLYLWRAATKDDVAAVR